MKAVYKYDVSGREVMLPLGAEVLSVGVQGDRVMIWAIVNTKEVDRETRYFNVVGTGQELGASDTLENFLGTVFVGPFVLHVFEQK